MKEKNQRIWEIDALRGFLILCVIAAHALFYLSQIRRAFALPPTVAFVIHYGGMLFVVLSGLSATLGRRSFRRGLTVFAGGMALTLGSLAAASFGWMDESMIIRFGVLHLLGFVMMVYPLLKKLPSPVLLVFGLAVIAVGYWFELDKKIKSYAEKNNLEYVYNRDDLEKNYSDPPTIVNFFFHEKIKKSAQI